MNLMLYNSIPFSSKDGIEYLDSNMAQTESYSDLASSKF